jgi:hypothetical protein
MSLRFTRFSTSFLDSNSTKLISLVRQPILGAASMRIPPAPFRRDSRRQIIGEFHSDFASCFTDFVVAHLLIVDLLDRPHAIGGFVICLANTR